MPRDYDHPHGFNIGAHQNFRWLGDVASLKHSDGTLRWKIRLHDSKTPLEGVVSKELILDDDKPALLADSEIPDAMLIVNEYEDFAPFASFCNYAQVKIVFLSQIGYSTLKKSAAA